jgi:hypothetical protein
MTLAGKIVEGMTPAYIGGFLKHLFRKSRRRIDSKVRLHTQHAWEAPGRRADLNR